MKLRIAAVAAVGLGLILLIQSLTFGEMGAARVVGAIGIGIVTVLSGLAVNAIFPMGGEQYRQ